MKKHKNRLIALAVVTVIVVAELLLPAFHIVDEATAKTMGQLTLVLLTSLGVVDASLVERRRRNPDVPAISDDVRKENTNA